MSISGKTVEVLGGRNTRPTARKCRNDKVNTARGPRDRRVRLSADTAIQFYDVQDRLGYEHASEAIDWLIEKAKVSIDKLFDISSQNCDHLDQLSDLNDVKSGYLPEKLSDRGEFEEPVHVQNLDSLADNSINLSGYNFLENSALFPHLHMENYMQDLSYKIEDSCFPSASSSNLKHDCMITFDSKLNLRSQKDEYDSTHGCRCQGQFVEVNQGLFPMIASGNEDESMNDI